MFMILAKYPSQVEFLLLECLQDLTGGKKFYKMAAQLYIMDNTSVSSRTARMCFLEATIGLAIMISERNLKESKNDDKEVLQVVLLDP